MLPALRILIGLVLLLSGLEKSISPYQNFLYVVQAYQMLPSWAEHLVAMVLPWFELLVGLMMVLGVWTMWALKLSMLCFGMFVVVVGQALWRGLPLDQCGCFGQWLHVLPQTIIVFDSVIMVLLVVLQRQYAATSRFSLDALFNQKKI